MTLDQLKKNLKKVDVNKSLANVLNRTVVKQMILSINKSRLFNKGETYEGEKLRTDTSFLGFVYNPATVNIKNAKGQPTDRVTLMDEGKFYKSFEVLVSTEGFEVVADFIRDGQDISENFRGMGENFKKVLGLSESELDRLREFIKPLLIQDVRSQIGV